MRKKKVKKTKEELTAIHKERWERNRVEVKSMRTARRNSRIYKERLDGWTLEDIGFEHGITRERARQILEGFYKKA